MVTMCKQSYWPVFFWTELCPSLFKLSHCNIGFCYFQCTTLSLSVPLLYHFEKLKYELKWCKQIRMIIAESHLLSMLLILRFETHFEEVKTKQLHFYCLSVWSITGLSNGNGTMCTCRVETKEIYTKCQVLRHQLKRLVLCDRRIKDWCHLHMCNVSWPI